MREQLVRPTMDELELGLQHPYSWGEVVEGELAQLPARHVQDADAIRLPQRPKRPLEDDGPAGLGDDLKVGVAAEDRRYLLI